MGQRTLGILYGTEAPLPQERLNDADTYEEPLYDLLHRFHTAAGIEMYASWDNPQPRVVQTSEGGKVLVGVWVAVGGSGKPAAAYFLEDAMPLEALAQVYAEQITTAQALWNRFATYCAEQDQLTLAVPQLWITPTEVA